MRDAVEHFRRSRTDWDTFYFGMAMLVASRSKDPHRQVGAVLVTPDRRQLSIGYNGLPADVPDDPELLGDRERKLALSVHAEANCIKQAPFRTDGCTLYVTHFPCIDCAVKLYDSRLSRVVAAPFDPRHPRWGKSWAQARALLENADMEVSLCSAY